MKVKKQVIEQIIREELTSYIRELTDEDEKKKSEVEDSEQAVDKPKQKNVKKPDPNVDPTMDKNKAQGSAPSEDEEVPDAPDPADDELDDEEEPGEDVTAQPETGKTAAEVTGKRIQSISVNPKSKLVPGAQEIVIAFEETPDSLKILITKTGQVKYFFRGLHDTL